MKYYIIEERGSELYCEINNPEGNIWQGVKIDCSNFPDCDEYKKITITGNNVVINGLSIVGLSFLNEIEIIGEVVKVGNVFLNNCVNLTNLSIIGVKTWIDGFNYRGCPNLKNINISSAKEKAIWFNCHFGRSFNGNPNVIIDGRKISFEKGYQKRL